MFGVLVVTPALNLPSFLPNTASAIKEPEAVSALAAMRRRDISGTTTVFAHIYGEDNDTLPGSQRARLLQRLRSRSSKFDDLPRSAELPVCLFLHGADSSTLEWRYLQPRLRELGVSSTAVDWWSGGWTDRGPILKTLDPRRPEPWHPVAAHLHEFWQHEMDGVPVVLVGASLGGAVALDFAARYPEAVRGLVLIDAGGQSYKSPPPAVVSALSGAVLSVKRALAWAGARSGNEELVIAGLHRDSPLWADALGAYFSSGGYQARVNRQLIRTVPAPTLVVWGDNDPILPLEDAYAFQRDLPRCVGVKEVAGCGHTPQLEQPDAVALHIATFAVEIVAVSAIDEL